MPRWPSTRASLTTALTARIEPCYQLLPLEHRAARARRAALATAPSRWLRWTGIAVAVVILVAVGSARVRSACALPTEPISSTRATARCSSTFQAFRAQWISKAMARTPARPPGNSRSSTTWCPSITTRRSRTPSEYTEYPVLPTSVKRTRQPRVRSKLPVRADAARRRKNGKARDRVHRLARLEERTDPLDATLVSGVAVPLNAPQTPTGWPGLRDRCT